jgi:hypothetical protein
MGSEYPHMIRFWEATGKSVEGVRVYDNWKFRLFIDSLHDAYGFGCRAQARAKRKNGHLLEEVEELRSVL